MHGIAFAELVVFLEDMSSDEDSAAVFRLGDLAKLYKDRLEQLGVTVDSRIHSTRLKNRLISELPELRAHSEGRDTLLTFQKNTGPALKKACDHDSDAMHLVRAAEVVLRDMFETRFSFDGSFQADCQKDAVPPSLLALVNMILDGSNIKHQTGLAETTTTSAALAISQLFVFNSVKHARKESTGSVRHNHSRETPLPLYLSMKIHAATRSRGLVDTLHSFGLCVSYDRLLQLSSDISNGVCQRFLIEDAVCPSGDKLRIGVKADLLHCLESSQSEDRSAPLLDATVIDGAVIVQMLNCGTSKTFQDYADTVFAPYISTQLQKNCRVHLVWDVYLPDSLKGTTREKRGTGTRKRVFSSAVTPKNWKEFLRVDGNKAELFVFLSEDAACRPQDYGKELYATRGSDVPRSPTELAVSNLAPCSHEEADTRLILHVAVVGYYWHWIQPSMHSGP